MRSPDPRDRTALEVRILAFLNDQPNRHPITLGEIVHGVNDDQKDSITCTVYDFKKEGLVTIRDLLDGEPLVGLTPQGIDIITRIYSRQMTCD